MNTPEYWLVKVSVLMRVKADTATFQTLGGAKQNAEELAEFALPPLGQPLADGRAEIQGIDIVSAVGDDSGQTCPDCGAVQDCTPDCPNTDRIDS